MSSQTFTQEALLKTYLERSERYRKFSFEIQHVLQALLAKRNISCLVTSRMKAEESFLKKASQTKYRVNPIKKITDIIGIRIVVINPNDKDRVEKVVFKNFKVIKKHTGDAAARLRPDQFGYRSIHIVARARQVQKLTLPALAECPGRTFEIQIRTLLEHAFAEVSHKALYKPSKKSMAKDNERSFYRAAAFLEECDNTLANLWKYARHTANRARKEMLHHNSASPLNASLCRDYLSNAQVASELVDKARSVGIKVVRDDSEAVALFQACKLAGIKAIQDLNAAINIVRENCGERYSLLQKAQESVTGASGASVDFLAGFLIAAHNNIFQEWINEIGVDPALAVELRKLFAE